MLAALRHRDATGEGQWIDAALYESAFRMHGVHDRRCTAGEGVVRERGGLQHAGWPGGAFETQDGRWIVFTAPAQHLFERLCAMLGQPACRRIRASPAPRRDRRTSRVILDLADRVVRGPTRSTRPSRSCKAHDIPHSPIMSMADIFADPHYREREMIIDVTAEGLGALPQPGVIPKLSATPGRVTPRRRRRSAATPTRSCPGCSGCRPREIAERRAAGAWCRSGPVDHRRLLGWTRA